MLRPDLDGRTALVTGSARGIGREIALELADCGADMAVHYRSSEGAAATTADEVASRGVDAATVQGDVTDPVEVAAIVEAAEDALGPVDVLVNNVGDFAPERWDDLGVDDWRGVLETNLLGTFLCTREVLPGMRERDWGRVVNVGYAGSEKALAHPRNFPYFVAKTGVIMFTRMVAADTRDAAVTVNSVSPYVVETSEKFPDHEPPKGRWAGVEDVAGVVLFFCDERADYVSGENVEVDGGWAPERL